MGRPDAYRSARSGAYTVAIRGTLVVSGKAWINEDFDIGATVPFSEFVSAAPAEALLSQGSANGLSFLLDLVPTAPYPGQGTMLSFLLGRDDLEALAVTGHSLGGTLTGPLFAALHAALGAGGSRGPQMDLMSFAGLTPGNQAFADHLDRITPRLGWRVVNPLDAAPHFFAGLSSVLQIYDAEGLSCPQRHAALIKKVFGAAATRYVQPGGEPTLLPRVFEKPKPLWITEAVRQHRFPTYLALVQRET